MSALAGSLAVLGCSAGAGWEETWRLLLAWCVGGVIGLNRQVAGQAGGLSTHLLVSLGAVLFLVIPTVIEATHQLSAISRMIQGVAVGVGCLGAGEIVRQARFRAGTPAVKGLTSAARLWVTAALGMLASVGLWQASLLGTLFTLFVLSGAKWLETFIPVQHEDEP